MTGERHPMSAIFKSHYPLILASSSPRRQQFLQELGLDFSVQGAAIAEHQLPGEQAIDFVRRLAAEKAAAVARQHPQAVVIGADTAVVQEGQILGKPDNEQQARQMIRQLAGGWHQVWSGFAVQSLSLAIHRLEAVCTEVCFAPWGGQVCDAYGASGDGLDKAGAYGIQSSGAFLVQEIRGSYSNVIGLPLTELVAVLQDLALISPA